jgi:hypothetical protein
LYTTYSRIFTPLSYFIKDKKLRKYAKFKAVLHFRTDVDFLERWKRKICLCDEITKDFIKKSFEDMRDIKSREANSTDVEHQEGWSPYKAKLFLKEAGFETNDYHEGFDNEWTCSSNYIEIEDGYNITNRLWYYVSGDQDKVTSLSLKLYVNNLNIETEALEKFKQIAKVLLKNASIPISISQLDDLFEHSDIEIRVNDHKRVILIKTVWEGGIKGGYDKKIIIDNTTE